MNTRLIITLLCAGAIAFACSPRSRSATPEALASALPVPSSNSVQRVVKRAGAASKSSAPKVNTRLTVDPKAHEVRLALDVANVSKKHVELVFPNGQRYDFAVVDSTGREVWRWSNGRLFTQIVQNKELPSGNAMQVSETWSDAVPGRYTAVATLKSTNYPVEERMEFVVR
jgi:hypothetical protein